MKSTPVTTIDQYMAGFPKEVQVLLAKMREVIQKNAPAAEEKIGYGIPTFTLNGNLVHFGAYKHHIGFYPGPSGITTFSDELSKFPMSKGAVQFPLDKALPVTLIGKIVKFRVKENLEKGAVKKKK